MSISGFILALITAAMTMTANLMLRAGIDAAGGFAPSSATGLANEMLKLFLQPLFSVGFVTYFLASVVWFRVIATEPLSVAYPILVSLTFCLVTAGAVVIFHEPLPLQKVLALAVILAGITMLSMEKTV